MAKLILKLFGPSGRPIIPFFSAPAPVPNSKGNLVRRGTKYMGWENVAILDWKRRLSRKRCEMGPWLLWNVNVARVCQHRLSFLYYKFLFEYINGFCGDVGWRWKQVQLDGGGSVVCGEWESCHICVEICRSQSL